MKTYIHFKILAIYSIITILVLAPLSFADCLDKINLDPKNSYQLEAFGISSFKNALRDARTRFDLYTDDVHPPSQYSRATNPKEKDQYKSQQAQYKFISDRMNENRKEKLNELENKLNVVCLKPRSDSDVLKEGISRTQNINLNPANGCSIRNDSKLENLLKNDNYKKIDFSQTGNFTVDFKQNLQSIQEDNQQKKDNENKILKECEEFGDTLINKANSAQKRVCHFVKGDKSKHEQTAGAAKNKMIELEKLLPTNPKIGTALVVTDIVQKLGFGVTGIVVDALALGAPVGTTCAVASTGISSIINVATTVNETREARIKANVNQGNPQQQKKIDDEISSAIAKDTANLAISSVELGLDTGVNLSSMLPYVGNIVNIADALNQIAQLTLFGQEQGKNREALLLFEQNLYKALQRYSFDTIENLMNEVKEGLSQQTGNCLCSAIDWHVKFQNKLRSSFKARISYLEGELEKKRNYSAADNYVKSKKFANNVLEATMITQNLIDNLYNIAKKKGLPIKGPNQDYESYKMKTKELANQLKKRSNERYDGYCDLALLNREPTKDELPSLALINGQYYSFVSDGNGSFSKKNLIKFDFSKENISFSSIYERKNLDKGLCEAIRNHGGHKLNDIDSMWANQAQYMTQHLEQGYALFQKIGKQITEDLESQGKISKDEANNLRSNICSPQELSLSVGSQRLSGYIKLENVKATKKEIKENQKSNQDLINKLN